jgi:ParB-like chromosome segregation protein Spo0J
LLPTADIVPYSRNSRTHSREQIAAIAASIAQFGFTNPLLVDESSVLIAGHGRLAAAQQLGIAELPAIVLAGLSDTQKQALRIADNKLALNAGWDDDLLRTELMDLRDVGFDLALTGFTPEELLGLDITPLDDLPWLPDGDKPSFQQMTFTLHDSQVGAVQAALEAAKDQAPFDGPNGNSNGNALARICEAFMAEYADS